MRTKYARSRVKDYAPQYSGDKSKRFWDRVMKLEYDAEGNAVYALACALQDLENRVVTALTNAEALQTQKKAGQ